MARNSSQDKNLSNILKNTLNECIKEYLDTLTVKDFLRKYIIKNSIKSNDIIIKSQLMNLDISSSTLNNYLGGYCNSLPSPKTLKIFALLFELSEYERKCLMLSYYNEIMPKSTNQTLDFLNALSKEILSDNVEKILLSIIKNYPKISQKELTEIFNVSSKTIQRINKKYGIKNKGSRKKPYWAIDDKDE